MNDEIYLLNPDYIGQTDPNDLYSCQILDYKEKGIVLAEAISCLMTEEINGVYELEMEYPVDSDLAGQIQVGNILAVKGYWHWGEQHASTVQLFRIYEVNKTINDYKMSVYASHISYDLAYYWVPPYTANSLTQSLTKIKEVWLTAAPVAPWRFGRIRDESQTPFYNPNYRSVRNNLIGDDGSILDVYGSGEYIWDNYDVMLATTRGADRGLVIRYGVNLSELEQTLNIDDTFSHIFSYWTDYDGNYARGSVKYILDDPEDRTFSANSRIYGIDASSFFDDIPTTSQLDIITDLMRAGISTKPDVNIKLTMSQFQDMLVDAGPVNVETQTYNYQVSLGDTITIQYDDFRNTVNSRTVSARIVKVVYNVMTHNFDELEIGKIKPNLDNSVVEIKEALPKNYTNFQITVLKHNNAIDRRADDLQDQTDAIVEDLQANYLTAAEISADYIQTQNLNAEVADLGYVTADTVAANYVQTQNLNAEVASLGYVTAGTVAANYLTVDGANIEDAVIERIFSDYELVDNLVIQNGAIVSGELQAVTLNADLMTAGTLKADRILIASQNQDGLYYQLNVNGETVEAQQTTENSLHGSHIIANTITASKISVTDLEAFGATIGAFEIGYSEGTSVTQGSIRSHNKTSATDNVEGVYLGVSNTGTSTTATFGIGAGNSNHIIYDGTTIDIETDWVDFDSTNNELSIGQLNSNNGAYFSVRTSSNYPQVVFYKGSTPLFELAPDANGTYKTISHMPLYVYGSGTSTIEGKLDITGTDAGGTRSASIDAGGEIYTSFGYGNTNNTRCVAIGSRMASATAIPNLLEELRYSSGCMGSFHLSTAYSNGAVTISTGWYNYIYVPHRQGGKNGGIRSTNTDNIRYGTLILSGMDASKGVFVLQYAGGSDSTTNLPTVSSIRAFNQGVINQGTITGTNGTWRYRKWSDGLSEVWYNGSITFTNAGSSYQGWYRSTQNVSIAQAVRNITGDFDDATTIQVTGAYNAHIYTSGGIKTNGTAFEAQVLGMNALAANTTATGWNVYIAGYPRAVG